MVLADVGSVLERLFDESGIATLSIVCGTGIAMVAIISGTVAKVATSRGKERTKRELAAYVAEGTLDPDKAVAMMKAGRPHWECGPQAKA